MDAQLRGGGAFYALPLAPNWGIGYNEGTKQKEHFCMNIRPAQPGDLPALLEIFAHARAFMAQTGNPTQWPATYPGVELMQ